MQPVDFFKEGEAYVSNVGTFHCIAVLVEHGKRYAWGRWTSSIVSSKTPTMRTYRDADYLNFKLA